jgi:hypothetical protein
MMDTSSSNPPQSDSPEIMNPLDLEEFKRQGYMMIDFLTDSYKTLKTILF